MEGKVDAIYSQSKVFRQVQEATGEMKAVEDLSRYPDWTLQIANIPAVITCTDTIAEQHPELVFASLKGMIRAGRWANKHQRAACAAAVLVAGATPPTACRTAGFCLAVGVGSTPTAVDSAPW